MKLVMKRIKQNLYRRYYQPEAGDYAVAICIAMVAGLVIEQVIRWLA